VYTSTSIPSIDAPPLILAASWIGRNMPSRAWAPMTVAPSRPGWENSFTYWATLQYGKPWGAWTIGMSMLSAGMMIRLALPVRSGVAVGTTGTIVGKGVGLGVAACGVAVG